MKNRLITTILPVILFLLWSGCREKSEHADFEFRYITAVEIKNPEALDVEIDNFIRTITIQFPMGMDISATEVSIATAKEVRMVNPSSPTSTYDLTEEAYLQIAQGNETFTYRILVRFASVFFEPSSDYWEKKDDFGTLPDYLSVYKYRKTILSKQVQAYIVVANISEEKARFRILGEKTGYYTPKQFYDNNFRPSIVLNGGYFWSGTSLGLIVRDGQIISGAQHTTYRDYNGTNREYYPTLGAFGTNPDNTFGAYWVYESNNTLYTYPNPSPNRTGEEPQPIPTFDFPEEGKEWKPQHAISAGPLLITKGEYKNLWEAEMFDAMSGVGPTVNHPRSAIGYHPSGHIVLFACEGRNQTPNTPGLTLEEIADILLDMGCTEAINLDGGGSSCMLVNGMETIIPSDGSQRTVTNAIAIY